MNLLLSCWEGTKEFDHEVEDHLSLSLKRQAYKFASRSRQYTFDDFFSFGLVGAWKAINSFRLICLRCKKNFGTIKTFVHHTVNSHRKMLSPLYRIESYVGLRQISAMQHELKKEYALKRYPNKASIISMEKCSPISTNKQSDFELRELIETVLKEFEDTELKIIRRMLDSYNTSEIVNELEELFGYDSAILRIVRQVKRKFAIAIKDSLSQAS